jgi:FlaA1/EpsC-like NDP-sugar epimerase
MVVRTAAVRAFRLTQERWRYLGTREVVQLEASCAFGSIVLFLLCDVVLPVGMTVPLSIIGMETRLTCGSVAGAWPLSRLTFERRGSGWAETSGCGGAVPPGVVGALAAAYGPSAT